MYAIVEIAGKQYKVRENDKLIVPRLSGDVDDSVTFDRVLLVGDDGEDVSVGTPVVSGASVTATIVEHVKGDKVLVFRKKRRKRFKVKRGHRQPYTRIEIGDLSVNGTSKTTSAAKKKKKKAQDDDAAQAEAAESAAGAKDVEATEAAAAATTAETTSEASAASAPSETAADEAQAEVDESPVDEGADEANEPAAKSSKKDGKKSAKKAS